MPQITGMDHIAAIREVAPLVPVVIISGYSPELAGLGEGRLPRAAVLTKPFSGEDLGRALARLLGDD
ncbi:MAG: hypothetical protein IAE82_18255 [Opitutaceae bacterium]|nr:hypothetical protein [Opitutaceae bacterium]